MKILFVGDIHGKPGKKVASSIIPQLREEEKIDFVIANGENAAGGFGITPNLVHKFERYGIDCITSGNHIWNKDIIIKELDTFPNLLRPANYPNTAPGKGARVYTTNPKSDPVVNTGRNPKQNKIPIGVINLEGRTFMSPVDCPFRTARKEIRKLKTQRAGSTCGSGTSGTRIIKIIIIDFHAESEAEKLALAHWLDGKVSAVLGTHTHVQTADEQILPKGTAYITDVGMTGSFRSVIGVLPEKSIKRFRYGIPQRFDTAHGDEELNGVILEINEKTGKAISIKKVKRK